MSHVQKGIMVLDAGKDAQKLRMVSIFKDFSIMIIIILFIISGNMSCHHVTGKFICAAGFTGMLCENPCSPGTYGLGCNSICKCEHGGECSHLTGECQCPPGWSGPSCNKACPEGFYGNNCSQVCKCKNESKCRKNDGHCLCPPGWMGVHCEDGK